MTTYWTTVPSPIDDLLVTSDGDAVTRIWFAPFDDVVQADWVESSSGVLGEARRQLTAYFAGQLTEFDLPLAPAGTPFQQRVWEGLRSIPYATTMSYGELATKLGSPSASRAVGLANGRNPIAVVVPCHRVIGVNGTLTGYAGGLERKKALLDLERSVAGPDQPNDQLALL
jgi:methylated-DNA-[protein]-cysteine S-methyltransferase